MQNRSSLQSKSCKSSPHQQGIELMRQQQFSKAIRKFNDAINNDEAIGETYLLKGVCEYKLKHYDDAIRTFETIINEFPEKEEAYSAKGICLTILEKYDQALQQHKKALYRNKDNWRCHYWKAYTLLRMKNYKGAFNEYSQAIVKDKNNHPNSYIGNAEALCHLKQQTEAQKNMGYAIKAINESQNLSGLFPSDRELLEEGLKRYEQIMQLADEKVQKQQISISIRDRIERELIIQLNQAASISCRSILLINMDKLQNIVNNPQAGDIAFESQTSSQPCDFCFIM